MSYTFVYPCDYFKPKKVDEAFLEESSWMKESGHQVLTVNSLLDIENEFVVYRGWMLNSNEYDELVHFVAQKDGKLLTSKEDYYRSHYLPNWYPLVQDVTPETIVIPLDKLNNENAILSISRELAWSVCFVKDYVKSLTTKQGSVASSPEELRDVFKSLDDFRTVEGGLCLRKIYNFVPESEIRYFSLNGKVFSPVENVSKLAVEVAKRFENLPFISIDIIKDVDGKEWLVEIGDGQVSEFKTPWSKEKVQEMFQS